MRSATSLSKALHRRQQQDRGREVHKEEDSNLDTRRNQTTSSSRTLSQAELQLESPLAIRELSLEAPHNPSRSQRVHQHAQQIVLPSASRPQSRHLMPPPPVPLPHQHTNKRQRMADELLGAGSQSHESKTSSGRKQHNISRHVESLGRDSEPYHPLAESRNENRLDSQPIFNVFDCPRASVDESIVIQQEPSYSDPQSKRTSNMPPEQAYEARNGLNAFRYQDSEMNERHSGASRHSGQLASGNRSNPIWLDKSISQQHLTPRHVPERLLLHNPSQPCLNTLPTSSMYEESNHTMTNFAFERTRRLQPSVAPVARVQNAASRQTALRESVTSPFFSRAAVRPSGYSSRRCTQPLQYANDDSSPTRSYSDIRAQQFGQTPYSRNQLTRPFQLPSRHDSQQQTPSRMPYLRQLEQPSWTARPERNSQGLFQQPEMPLTPASPYTRSNTDRYQDVSINKHFRREIASTPSAAIMLPPVYQRSSTQAVISNRSGTRSGVSRPSHERVRELVRGDEHSHDQGARPRLIRRSIRR